MSLLDTIVKSVYDPDAGKPVPPPPVAQETPEPEEVMSPGNVDNKTITELRKVLEETIGAAGADDYMVFMKSVNKTAKLIPDEATRFKASAETLGVSSDAVAKSSSKYLDRLKQERVDYDETMRVKYETEVTARKNEITGLERDNHDATIEIQKLNELIAKNTETIAKLSGQAQEAEVKIASKKANFTASMEQVIAEIKSNVQKIQNYIGVKQ